MTKDAILRFIEEIDEKLAELRRAIEQLPETVEASQAGPLPEPGRENTVLLTRHAGSLFKCPLRVPQLKTHTAAGSYPT